MLRQGVRISSLAFRTLLRNSCSQNGPAVYYQNYELSALSWSCRIPGQTFPGFVQFACCVVWNRAIGCTQVHY